MNSSTEDTGGRVALVTGSSRGIGRAAALRLARDGFTVVVHGSRESDDLDSSLEQVKAVAPASIKAAVNLADVGAIGEMFATIESTFDRLDALVNNAAIQNPSHMLDLSESDWDLVMSVNLKAPFLCTQYAGRIMRRCGGGKIVNITSVHAHATKRNYVHYSCSKGGLETLTKCTALELAEFNVQANSLVVGAVATSMTPPDRCEKLLSAIPAHRIAAPEEVAALTAFLCSNECDYMTGASIAVDGGIMLGFCAARPDL